MIQNIETITQEVNDFIIENAEALELYRLKFLSRKGSISELFEVFKELPGIEKRDIGKPLNILKSFCLA
jgi:phenylalanyl-tRNA synthetase alpha chain